MEIVLIILIVILAVLICIMKREIDAIKERMSKLTESIYREDATFSAALHVQERRISEHEERMMELESEAREMFASAKEANEESIRSNKLFQDGLNSILNYDAVVKHD